MDNIFINLGDMVSVGQDSVSVFDSNNILSTSDTLVGPQGPPGPPGKDGKDGVDGEAATIQVGTTTTTEPGTNAVVTNSGDEHNAVLNFSIPRGATGETGPAGEDGTDGEDGFSPEAYVTQNPGGATITITDASGTTAADVFNGPAGPAATIAVGSTTTGNPGTNASVTNSGTSSAAVFDFTIPRGADGQDGQDGQDGAAATIAVGTTTTGNPGTNASVTNSGTSSAAVFNFVIPRGDTGAAGQDGQDGQDGAAATIAVGSTTTGNAGTNASVTNSGTSSAAVLDFVIPRGDTGAAGSDGADGYSPTATVTQNTGSATISITDKNGTTTATVYDGVTPDTSVTSYSLTNLPAHSGGTNGYALRKQLSVVCLDIDVIWMNSISANSWTNIGTLPSGIYPTSSIVCPVVMTNGSNGNLFAYGKMNVQTNGNIRINVTTALSGLCAVSGSISWII